MEVVVEILEQGQRKSRLERLDMNAFSIGRSWDADIIIQDPEIDAEHLWVDLIEAEDNDDDSSQFYISDCETVNGSKVGKHPLNQNQPVRWGKWITIGNTKICLHDVLSPVAAVKRRTPIDIFVSKLQLGWVALGLMVLAILNAQYNDHLARAVSFSWESAIDNGVQLLATLLSWAVAWGSITRLTKHQFQIWLHLSLVSIVLIASTVLSDLSTIIVFNSLSTIWLSWSSTVISLLIGISWLLFVLYVGTNLGFKKRLGITTTIVFFYLLTTQILPQMRSDNWVAVPKIVTVARPASLLVIPESGQEDYLFNIENAFERADKKALDAQE